MEKIFEADNRKADEWWANAKVLRLIHRCQVPAGFRSNPSKRLLIAINLQGRSVAFLSSMRTLVSFIDPHSSEIDFCFSHHSRMGLRPRITQHSVSAGSPNRRWRDWAPLQNRRMRVPKTRPVLSDKSLCITPAATDRATF